MSTVSREDHDAVVAELQARIEALEKELVYLAGEVAEGSDMVVEAATVWARLAAKENTDGHP